MEVQQLRDPQIPPSDEALESALKTSYPAWQELFGRIARPPYDLIPQWRYYNDGKAWLCKVTSGKKTIFWLSVWDRYFKISFYFTFKSNSGVMALDIAEGIKEDFRKTKSVGKLIPLTVNVHKKIQVKDLLKIIEYKKGLK